MVVGRFFAMFEEICGIFISIFEKIRIFAIILKKSSFSRYWQNLFCFLDHLTVFFRFDILAFFPAIFRQNSLSFNEMMCIYCDPSKKSIIFTQSFDSNFVFQGFFVGICVYFQQSFDCFFLNLI